MVRHSSCPVFLVTLVADVACRRFGCCMKEMSIVAVLVCHECRSLGVAVLVCRRFVLSF